MIYIVEGLGIHLQLVVLHGPLVESGVVARVLLKELLVGIEHSLRHRVNRLGLHGHTDYYEEKR